MSTLIVVGTGCGRAPTVHTTVAAAVRQAR
jgi:hypothetical protein